MAHRANINFYLYTGFNASALDSFEAFQHMKASGIDFSHLHYADPVQHEEVINWANQNFANTPYAANVTQFPFATYDKAFDFKDNPPRETVLVYGVDAIKAIDWAALANFEG